MYVCGPEISLRQSARFVGRFQNDEQCKLFQSGKIKAENRTRQNGQVIGDLYSPDSFDTRLGEWASANVQPC